jgi:cytochrome c oxidase subunit 1
MEAIGTMADEQGRLIADSGQRRLATAWLALGITALAFAGLFAILLVVARAPGTEAMFPTQDFFRVALIVHVDQSVLIWFLAFGGLLWGLGQTIPALSWPAFTIAAAGCLLVAAAPFLGAADPLLNNYVPVLDHPLFLTALAMFGVGSLIQVIAYLARAWCHVRIDDPLAVGTVTAAFAALLAGFSLLWTWLGMNPAWEGKAFYEYLFWGPGHVLQFAYTQIMLVAWIWVARSVGRPLGVSDRWLSALLVLGVVPLILVPVIHGFHAPDSAESRLHFTRLMQYGNALAAVPIGLLLAVSMLRHRRVPMPEGKRAAYRALVASLVLFAVGGLIGSAIAGVNTVIPAHYHGSIVGVTLSLMGLTYHLLPEIGFGRADGRMARWQAMVYGSGQLLHIAGLAASGAMGIQRKTAGAAQGLDGAAKAFMGVMGLGGLLAVIGGIMFVLVVLGAFANRPPKDLSPG